MSYLSMVEAKLPPGFRFHPRDEELVCDYLARKVSGDSGNGNLYNSCPMIIDVDLNKCEPWELPEVACVGGKEWYFFNLRDRKYATGQRTNRATQSGYWKATGKDRPVSRRGVLVGMRKTLVFYEGRAPKGRKTDWVMHEFRMEGSIDPPKFSFKEDWVLCRVLYKTRGGAAKSTTATCYDESGSSSLPPLLDTYIAFDQAAPPPQPPLPSSFEGYGQVPCFSTFPPTSTSGRSNGGAGAVVSPPPPLRGCSGDKDVVINAVLSHFNKLEGHPILVKRELPPSNMADEGSLESFLTESISHAWNAF